MTIGKKITVGFTVVLVLMTIAVVTGFYTIRKTQSNYTTYLDVYQKLVDYANEIRFEIRDEIAHLRGLLLIPDEERNFLEKLREDFQQIKTTKEEFRKLVITDQGRRMVDDIYAIQTKHQQAQEKIIALIQEGKRAEAIIVNGELIPLTAELLALTDNFIEREIKIKTVESARTNATLNRLSGVMMLVSILAILSGIGISYMITKNISRQLRESIAQLSSSSAEILSTTAQVTSSAEETATAVSETTATIEEVKQTAQLSSQKAKYVTDTAQNASQISQSGKKAVEESLVLMNRIREQMESVAESAVRLSEQSQAIGEIISAVNDIAEQSNLLAVNAAIEAARAGEQGKGFTVVAQEVKSLAEQSKQATAQVHAILSDIQKGVSIVVIVTEQGSKSVEAGVKQSAEAGEAVQVLTNSVSEAAQAATQIAASSHQQSVGMEQVASAMESINQATIQNLAGIKQAEQAAQNLNGLAQRFKSMIGGKKA
jgi:methyl-accepting chemotaxis protein